MGIIKSKLMEESETGYGTSYHEEVGLGVNEPYISESFDDCIIAFNKGYEDAASDHQELPF